MYGSMGSRRRFSSRDSQGSGQIIYVVIAIIAAILAPILVQLFYFALSRKREYLADAGAARLTRYPEGLASALEKISGNTAPLSTANEVTAPMYIDTPFRGGAKAFSLLSTHPPIEERVRILRSMSQGASLKDYAQAYRQTIGSDAGLPLSAQEGCGNSRYSRGIIGSLGGGKRQDGPATDGRLGPQGEWICVCALLLRRNA